MKRLGISIGDGMGVLQLMRSASSRTRLLPSLRRPTGRSRDAGGIKVQSSSLLKLIRGTSCGTSRRVSRIAAIALGASSSHNNSTAVGRRRSM